MRGRIPAASSTQIQHTVLERKLSQNRTQKILDFAQQFFFPSRGEFREKAQIAYKTDQHNQNSENTLSLTVLTHGGNFPSEHKHAKLVLQRDSLKFSHGNLHRKHLRKLERQIQIHVHSFTEDEEELVATTQTSQQHALPFR